MTLLTMKNIVVLGLGVFSVSMIVDALPDTGSSVLAQSSVITDVSAALERMMPSLDAPTTESLANLLHIGERTYQVSFDANVSSEVISSGVVRKIAFGNDTLVSIVKTPSGTYSTDGFASSNVHYLGVSVFDVSGNQNALDLKVLQDGQFVDWSAIAQTQ